MSVLSRNELRVVLCPDHAALLAVEHRLTPRGVRHELKRREIVAAAPGTDGRHGLMRRRHDHVIMALDAALAANGERKTTASVTLSNHFFRYVLVPWSDALGDDAEQMAYARHCFREVYGEVADNWELRLSPDQDGVAQLASAVDRRLLETLRDTFARHGIAIDSIRPHLMTAYNGVYPTLKRRSAWFGLVEPGNLCLGLLRQGRLSRLRSMRIGAEWQAELPLMLDREACLAGMAGEATEVLLVAPDEGPLHFPRDSRWQFRRLHPAPQPQGLPAVEWGFADAANG